jgi:hypothetical protein
VGYYSYNYYSTKSGFYRVIRNTFRFHSEHSITSTPFFSTRTQARFVFELGQERVLCRHGTFAYPRIGNGNFNRAGLGFRICKF